MSDAEIVEWLDAGNLNLFAHELLTQLAWLPGSVIGFALIARC